MDSIELNEQGKYDLFMWLDGELCWKGEFSTKSEAQEELARLYQFYRI